MAADATDAAPHGGAQDDDPGRDGGAAGTDAGRDGSAGKQDDLPEGARKAIEAARKAERSAARRAAEAEAKVKEWEDRDKSEAEKLAERLSTAERDAAEATARLLRFEVAADRGLDAKMADFLTGQSREEIEAKADELSRLIEERDKSLVPGFDGGAREPAAPAKSPEQAHNDLLMAALGRPQQ